MLFTDPPWNVDFGGSEHPSWKKRSILNDKMSEEDFYKFFLFFLMSAQSACEPGAPAYIVMSSQEFGALQYAAKEVGFHWSSTLTWVKDTHVMSRKDYHTQTEFIWYGWRKGAGRLVHLEDRNQSDAWMIPRPKKSIEHPTMKPIELVAKAINNSSRKGDLVLDLFGGSGSTLIAAEQTDRTAHLMELDPKYCDVIAIRFAKMMNTDEGIYLIRDGKRISFNEAMEAVPEVDVETEAETEESQS
jgi:DNA modification methylase